RQIRPVARRCSDEILRASIALGRRIQLPDDRFQLGSRVDPVMPPQCRVELGQSARPRALEPAVRRSDRTQEAGARPASVAGRWRPTSSKREEDTKRNLRRAESAGDVRLTGRRPPRSRLTASPETTGEEAVDSLRKLLKETPAAVDALPLVGGGRERGVRRR